MVNTIFYAQRLARHQLCKAAVIEGRPSLRGVSGANDEAILVKVK